MATITFQDNPITTIGELPAVGSPAPDFDLVGADLGAVKLADYAGKRVVLNIFPSLDTGVCALSVRTFNQSAAELDNTVVLSVSLDLPFAMGRFCSVEGIENVVSASGFRSTFGADYGVTITEGPLTGLYSRAVVVLGTDGTVLYTEQVPDIKNEPDYEAALAALN